jgi:hypothetical protein
VLLTNEFYLETKGVIFWFTYVSSALIGESILLNPIMREYLLLVKEELFINYLLLALLSTYFLLFSDCFCNDPLNSLLISAYIFSLSAVFPELFIKYLVNILN